MGQRTCAIEGCGRKARARGWCHMHYKRWWRNGQAPDAPEPTLRQLFWANVTYRSGCWEWDEKRRRPNGYGRFYYKGKTTAAHRLSFELANGPIPPGLDVLHQCDNPPCVNPSHLFLGNDRVNSDDKYAKRRANTTHSGRGKKLTWAEVDEMRRCFDVGTSNEDAAEQFGISAGMAWRIRNHMSWDPAKRRPSDP